MFKLAPEHGTHAEVFRRRTRFIQFSLQHLEENATELLSILLNLRFFLTPPERLHKLLGRDWLLVVSQPIEQYLEGGREFIFVSHLSLKDQVSE